MFELYIGFQMVGPISILMPIPQVSWCHQIAIYW